MINNKKSYEMAEKKKPSLLVRRWNNIKWFIREIGTMYSSGKSFFSKKRIESGVAFIVAQWGMIFFILENHSEMTSSDLAIWAGIEFAVAGYIVNQIQREKQTGQDSSSGSN